MQSRAAGGPTAPRTFPSLACLGGRTLVPPWMNEVPIKTGEHVRQGPAPGSPAGAGQAGPRWLVPEEAMVFSTVKNCQWPPPVRPRPAFDSLPRGGLDFTLAIHPIS